MALLLALGPVAARAQAPSLSVSGDYGEVGSAISETSASTLEEPAAFIAAPDRADPFDWQDCLAVNVKTNIVFADPVFANPASSLSLTARVRESQHEYGDGAADLGSGFLVLGDYRPYLAFSAAYRLRFVKRLDNSFHACLSALNVSAVFTPVITIARELTHGSCLEREVLAHERGHWAIDKAILPELSPRLEAAAVAGTRAGFDGESVAEVKARVSAALRSNLDAFIGVFKAERQAGQAAHDSPEERARIDQACGGAAAALAARFRTGLTPKPAP